MKIVIVTGWFSEQMGYSESCLAKALASNGHEVSVVTSTANVYCDEPYYDDIYEPFLGPRYLKPKTYKVDGYTVHRLPIIIRWKRIHIFKNLIKTIKSIKPDVVQCYEPTSMITLFVALARPFLRYKLFTAIHTVASVYPAYFNYSKFNFLQKLRLRVLDTLPGKIISIFTTISYGATVDASEIGAKFFGIPKHKIKTDPLGVDTQSFSPINSSKIFIQERNELRNKYNIKPEDILCIYTGRFTEGKNPLILAQAIDLLSQKGFNFKALFIGTGNQISKIKEHRNCIVRPFVLYNQLPKYYRMAEIGVWPKQESTSMIDAAASGIPIVVSSKVQATERVENNGLTYIENNVQDLVLQLSKLSDEKVRNRYGSNGRKKMKKHFSWNSIAQKRIIDYSAQIKD